MKILETLSIIAAVTVASVAVYDRIGGRATGKEKRRQKQRSISPMSIFLYRKNLQESDGEMPLFPYIVRHGGRKNPINIGFLLGDRGRTPSRKSYDIRKILTIQDQLVRGPISQIPRHPRYHVHFTPTSGSWLNLVERLFAEITERCVRRGSHTAVHTLEKAMLDYLDNRNQDPKPFIWTASPDLILGKVQRLSKRFSNSGH
jgi:hypothetical protein